MTDKRMFYWSLKLKREIPAGVSAHVSSGPDLYFSTQRKLEKWRKANPEQEKEALWAMHEITVFCARELIKLSKKKPKETCPECGKS